MTAKEPAPPAITAGAIPDELDSADELDLESAVAELAFDEASLSPELAFEEAPLLAELALEEAPLAAEPALEVTSLAAEPAFEVALAAREEATPPVVESAVKTEATETDKANKVVENFIVII